MKYCVVISILVSVAIAVPRKYLDGHPEDDSWGKLNPAQAAEHQQNDYRQQRFGQPTNPYGPNQYGQPNNQFGPPNNPYGPAYPQYGAPQNQYGTQGQYGAQNQYPQQPGGYGYAGYNGGLPQGRGKKGRKNGGQGFGPPMQPPMQQPYGQAPYGQPGFGQQPQQPGQCASPCSQACAPACSSQCCGANNAFTAMQPPPSMTQNSCPGACPNSCAPVCNQKCCWDKRTTIPKPAAIPHPYQQYYY